MNAKRVQRIWRREGLKVPQKQPKRGRLWLNDGSCIRLRPCWPNHVWSYDFVMDRTHDGRKFRMLTVMVGPALGAGQHVVNVHHPEREVRVAADTHAFLFAVEAVAVRPVVRKVA